jgi:hypothetical protein
MADCFSGFSTVCAHLRTRATLLFALSRKLSGPDECDRDPVNRDICMNLFNFFFQSLFLWDDFLVLTTVCARLRTSATLLFALSRKLSGPDECDREEYTPLQRTADNMVFLSRRFTSEYIRK